MTTDKNFEHLYCRRPHVVIVGAGASKAVMGDACPTMNGAIEQIGLDKILNRVKLQTTSKNLEAIYSELFNRGDECKDVRIAMEKALFDYFSNVHLPETLTIYDLLILSLTNKDCIISFNWDKLLIEAYNRVSGITNNKPEMLFLHGNVGAGVCEDCMTFGPIQNHCPKCRKPYKQVPLLYPVEKKDYKSNIFIRNQWTVAKDYISRAGKVTIYGYSAPSSDKEASETLKASFSKYENVHRLDTVEVIERPGFNRSEISDTWEYFFSKTNYHQSFEESFFDSSLAKAPRRTIQFQHKQFVEGWWEEPSIYFTEEDTFNSAAEKLKELLDDESKGVYSVI